jgi:hypothetical protein
MPTALGQVSPPGVADYPPRRRWTRSDIEFYEKSGVFDGLRQKFRDESV